MRNPTIVILIAVTVLTGCKAATHASAQSQPLSGELGVYRRIGELHSLSGLGLFGIEVVLADMNKDHFPDLIMSSGDLKSPQPLVVYTNTTRKRPFLDRPSWYSGTIAHRGALAVGDIDGSGTLDLVVPVLFDNAARPSTGALEVFLSDTEGNLPSDPSHVLPMPDVPLSVALGDVDADGDLDAVVASVGRLNGGVGTPTSQQVYFNRERKLTTADPWVGPTLAAASVLLSDLDQDGWLDLVFGGDRVAIVHGSETSLASPWESRTLWLQTPFNAALGMSAGRVGTAQALSLVVADNCRASEGPCDHNGLWLFEPNTGGLPTQSGSLLRKLENGSRVRFLDANNDGNADLVVTQLGEKELGAPALLLQGDNSAKKFESQFSTECFPGAGIAIGDPLNHTIEDTLRITDVRGPIITIPKQHVAEILRVAVNGLMLEQDRFSWVPGTNWVSVSLPEAGSSNVTITYSWSKLSTLILASYDPRFGPRLLFSDYMEPAPTGPP